MLFAAFYWCFLRHSVDVFCDILLMFFAVRCVFRWYIGPLFRRIWDQLQFFWFDGKWALKKFSCYFSLIIIRYPPGKKEMSYIVPESVLIIGEYAFGDCKNLTSIKLPKGLKYICNCAFTNCSKLEMVNIPEFVYFIGSCVFTNCFYKLF